MADREGKIKSLCDSQKWDRAFALIVEEFSEELYWLIRHRVGTHDDANDVLQEVFILIWKNLKKFRWESKLRSWMYRIGINESYTFLRKQSRRKINALDDETSTEIESLKADSWFDGDAAILKLEKAIRSLPTKQRQVFEMRYYEDLPYEEIHQITGTSVGALKAQYHHTQKKIKEALAED